MNNQPSPLETLAAFAIVFAAGVVSTATLGTYIGYLRRKAAAHLSQSVSATNLDAVHPVDGFTLNVFKRHT
jgi:hypothetical protein